jgi:hypothetical protein
MKTEPTHLKVYCIFFLVNTYSMAETNGSGKGNPLQSPFVCPGCSKTYSTKGSFATQQSTCQEVWKQRLAQAIEEKEELKRAWKEDLFQREQEIVVLKKRRFVLTGQKSLTILVRTLQTAVRHYKQEVEQRSDNGPRAANIDLSPTIIEALLLVSGVFISLPSQEKNREEVGRIRSPIPRGWDSGIKNLTLLPVIAHGLRFGIFEFY